MEYSFLRDVVVAYVFWNVVGHCISIVKSIIILHEKKKLFSSHFSRGYPVLPVPCGSNNYPSP